jgi:branched-chain amino acid transport system substrate-binding protein
MRNRRILIATFAIAGLAVAACGDDGGSASGTTTATTAAPAGGSSVTTTTGAGPKCTIDRSLKIVGLAEKPPEGPNALVDYSNGFDLAVKELNAAGGVCGKPVEFERLAASPTDNVAAKNAYLSALDKKADAIVGIPNGATVLALAPVVAANATPTLYLAAAPQVYLGVANTVGSPWGFVMRPRNSGSAAIQASYLVNDLGKKKVGLLCANQAFGQQGCDAAKTAIVAAGGAVVGQETAEISATNMTSQVIALKNSGADGIMAFQFPNAIVVFVNQSFDNGFNVPVFAGATAALAIQSGNVNSKALANVWGLDDCVPAVDTRAAVFAAAYKAAYNAAPNYAGAESYDSVMVIADAVRRAGSLDKTKIADALRTTKWAGACTDFVTDAQNGMHHAGQIESFAADGAPVIKKSVPIPAPA